MSGTITTSDRPTTTLPELGTPGAVPSPLPPGQLSATDIQAVVAKMIASIDEDPSASWPSTDSVTTASTKDVGGTTVVGKATGVQTKAAVRDVTGTTPTLGGVTPAKVTLDADARLGAETFAGSINQAFNDVFVKGYDDKGQPIYKSINELSSDDLLAAFLKLNITDPNNDVQVQDKLLELAKQMRQGALVKEKADLKNQEAKLKEAEKKQASAKVLSTVIAVVMVIVAVVVAVVTFGAAAGLIALAVIAAGALIGMAASGGKTSGALMGMQYAAMIVMLVCSLGTAFPAVAASLGATTAASTAAAAGAAASQAAAEAAAQTAAQISAEAAKQAAKAAVEAAVKEALKGATQEAIKEAAQQAAQQALQTAAQGATQEAIQAASQAVAQAVSEGVAQSMAQQAALQSAVNLGATAASAGGSVASASAQKDAADAFAAADMAALIAKMAELRAQQAQKDIEERNEMIRMIMESKGAIVDAVLKMMNAAQATNMKLATISASR